jgi:diamine N-acetyltransferase
MTVHLRPITVENWIECINLKPTEEQERAGFVATNAVSLAQASFEPWWEPMGIYAGDTMAGFVMHGRWPPAGIPSYYPKVPAGADCILRFMIGGPYQRQGVGRAALAQVIERIRRRPGAYQIQLSYDPHNSAAAALYASMGFRLTGQTFHEELEAVLDLHTT